jgi:hypothetical protein
MKEHDDAGMARLFPSAYDRLNLIEHRVAIATPEVKRHAGSALVMIEAARRRIASARRG